MLLCSNSCQSGGWISRWPIAFFIGITAGYRMIGYVEADLVAQIKAGIVPLWITGEGGFEFWPTFNALFIHNCNTLCDGLLLLLG